MQDSFAACPAATTPGAVYGRRRDDFRTAHPHAALWPDFLTGQPNKPVRVLLIDDDVHIRKVISQELLKDLRTSLIAEGGSLREGRRLISRYDFDVMLVDLNLGDGHGFDLIELMKTLRPLAEAVVVSALENEQSALRAFELGATGYLVKNSWFGNFPDALLQVVNGGASISPGLARRLLRQLEPSTQAVSVQAAPQKNALTKREEEILQSVAAGYTSVEISLRLAISCQTVNTHIKNIYRKLQIHSRSQAIASLANRQSG